MKVKLLIVALLISNTLLNAQTPDTVEIQFLTKSETTGDAYYTWSLKDTLYKYTDTLNYSYEFKYITVESLQKKKIRDMLYINQELIHTERDTQYYETFTMYVLKCWGSDRLKILPFVQTAYNDAFYRDPKTGWKIQRYSYMPPKRH